MKWFVGLFKKRPFLKNVVLLSGGTTIAQLIRILSTPLITRLYLPEHFGILTIFVSFLGILIPLSTLRYAIAIPVAENDDLAENILRICFVITFVMSVIFALGLVLFRNVILERYPDNDLSSYLWLFPICLFGAGLYQALLNWSVRCKNFKIIARTRLSQGISSAATKVGLGWLGVRPFGLLLGYSIAQVAGTGTILLSLLKQKPYFFRKNSFKDMIYAAKRFARFPLVQSWSQLILGLGAQLPAFFIVGLYGAKAVGFYGFAFSMVSMPMNLLGQSVAQVYFAEISEIGKTKPGKIFHLSLFIVKKLCLVALVPILFILILGPLAFSLIFGEEWREAGVYARILCIPIFFGFILMPVMNCLNVLEKQGTQFLINSIRILLIVVVFIFCNINDFDLFTSILFYSIALSIFRLGTMVILYKMFRALIYVDC